MHLICIRKRQVAILECSDPTLRFISPNGIKWPLLGTVKRR